MASSLSYSTFETNQSKNLSISKIQSQNRRKNKTIKKGGAAKTTTKKLTASQRRGFDPNNLDEKSKGFLDLFNLPRKTANDKITFLNNINNYDCTGCNLRGSVFSQKNLINAKLRKHFQLIN